MKDKKSFKKYATKHLAGEIVRRRTTQKGRKEKAERIARRKRKEHDDAAQEEREHKAELQALKDADPNFYSYLEEEDPTLLQFGDEDMDLVDDQDGSDAETDVDEEEEELDLDEDELAEMEDAEAPDGEATKLTGRVTKAELQEQLKKKDLSVMVNLFVSAAREIGAKIKDSSAGGDARRKFTDPSLVKETLVTTAKVLGDNLGNLVKGDNLTPSFKTAKARTICKRFLLSSIAVIVDVGSDVVLCTKVLQSIVPFIAILHLLRGCTKAVLKVALSMCASSEETIRIAAYMVVRRIATRAAGSRTMYQSSAFKGIFLCLIRTAHNYTIHNMPIVGFLMNCVVDLYGTDMEAAYQHTFVYLRQLAIYLRAALQTQSQSNVRTVFNWQFVNALRTWGLVVGEYPNPEQLGPLIHPVVQLALGVMDLFSSPRCFPMHLHILEMLNQLSSRSGVYVPISTYILRIVSSPSLAIDSALANQGKAAAAKKEKKGENAGEDSTDLQFSMRVKKSQQRSQTYIVGVWSECLYLLVQHLSNHSHCIGFPEVFWVVSSTLNKLRKEVRYPKLHSQLSVILQHISTVSKAITAKRNNVTFGPCDATGVKMFEDELRQAATSTPFKALAKYYDALRAARVTDFAAKQQAVNAASGKGSGRTTLESVVEKRKAGSKQQSRDDDDADERPSRGKKQRH